MGFALAGGIIGRLKGSSFLLWFILSGIPPFVGLLAAILYRVEYDEPHRRCPPCVKVVPVDAALPDAAPRCAARRPRPPPPRARARAGARGGEEGGPMPWPRGS